MMTAALAIAGAALIAEPPPPGQGAALPEVGLVEQGGEPRMPLRYAFRGGDEFIVEVVTRLEIDEVEGLEGFAPEPAPPMRQRMRVTVVDAEGDTASFTARWDIPVMAEGGGDREVSEFEQSFDEQLAELPFSFTIDRRGRTHSADVDVPDEVDRMTAQMARAMVSAHAAMVVPFPEEPVGAGASWTARRELQGIGIMAGAPSTLETVYELVSVEGERVQLVMRSESIMDPSEFIMPMMELVEGAQRSSGEATVELSMPLPQRWAERVHIDMTLHSPMLRRLGQESTFRQTGLSESTVTTERGGE